MTPFQELLSSGRAQVGVIGLGYVGLPLALVFAEAGLRVTGFDIDSTKVAAIAAGRSYIKHIGPERVTAAVREGRFRATNDFRHLLECDAILICVPTPLGPHREPDNSFIHRTTEQIAALLRPGQLVVLESTTYPGTTDEEVRAILERGGLQTPRDFFLAFSPEREDPGNPTFSTRTIPKVVGGVNPASTTAAAALYAVAFERVVPVANARVAEAAKLLENTFRSVNIALVNELKITFERMGIDVWEVIEAAKTKPFGFTAFYPGPGLGGHCIPIDPFYLSWKAAEYGMQARFVELAGEMNRAMPRYVVSKVVAGLNEEQKSVKGSQIVILGLSYKADIDDDRESPSYEVLALLREMGAEIAYCDPYFPEMPRKREHDLGLCSVRCDAETLASFDAVVLCTAHREFTDPALYAGVRLLVDTRHALPAASPAGPVRLVRA